MSPYPRHHKAFSLVELMVVVAIILVLVGLLVPVLDHAFTSAACGAWAAFSKNVATDPDMVAYYNFENHDGHELTVRNLATGDPQSDVAYVTSELTAEMPEEATPNWTSGRWPCKRALEMDGPGSNDYAVTSRMAGQYHLNFSGSFTVAAWFKVNSFDVSHQALVTHGDNTWRLQRNGGGTGITFATNGLAGGATTSTPVNDGAWHFVAGVYDQNTRKKHIYLDGRLEDTENVAATANLNFGNYGLGIGQNHQSILGGSDRNWNGLIDEIFVLKRAWTPEEVEDIYVNHAP